MSIKLNNHELGFEPGDTVYCCNWSDINSVSKGKIQECILTVDQYDMDLKYRIANSGSLYDKSEVYPTADLAFIALGV